MFQTWTFDKQGTEQRSCRVAFRSSRHSSCKRAGVHGDRLGEARPSTAPVTSGGGERPTDTWPAILQILAQRVRLMYSFGN